MSTQFSETFDEFTIIVKENTWTKLWDAEIYSHDKLVDFGAKETKIKAFNWAKEGIETQKKLTEIKRLAALRGKEKGNTEADAFLFWLALTIWCVLSLLVHVWVCVATNWAAMLIAGVIFFPIGVIHGTGIIFSWW